MSEVLITIRWRDMDAYGHVNNGVYLNYLEEARDGLAAELFGEQASWDFVLAHVEIDFRSQLTQADGTITVRSEVAGLGTSSVRTRERIFKSDGTLAAEAASVIVPRNAEGTGSRPLTEDERRTIDAAIVTD
ncbi:MAG: acyl-CoA thioester hydrolase [Actinomycetota bacterium]|jgi:acyl-CoA thioester hydrolase|nr:acyl-CoA thioester hydrolase [Actinomycetota bacterium]